MDIAWACPRHLCYLGEQPEIIPKLDLGGAWVLGNGRDLGAVLFGQ